MEAYVISGLGKGPRRHSVIIHQGQYTHCLFVVVVVVVENDCKQ